MKYFALLGLVLLLAICARAVSAPDAPKDAPAVAPAVPRFVIIPLPPNTGNVADAGGTAILLDQTTGKTWRSNSINWVSMEGGPN